MTIEKRKLGRTGLAVTVLGYGAGQLRGERIWDGRPVTEESADRILNAVLDAGINFIDTANCYGKSEEFIGRCISSRRDEFYLATKCGCTVIGAGDHDEVTHVYDADTVRRNIDKSLERLRTDQVDLLQLHTATPEDVEQGDLLSVLEEIRSSGRARFLGVSTKLPHIDAFLEMDFFDTFQIPYSALERAHESAIAKIGRRGIGTIIRGGVAKGAVAKQAGSDWQQWREAGLDELLGDMSRMEFMLRFTLNHSHLHTNIVATLNPEHLQHNLEAAMLGPLDDRIYREACERLDRAAR